MLRWLGGVRTHSHDHVEHLADPRYVRELGRLTEFQQRQLRGFRLVRCFDVISEQVGCRLRPRPEFVGRFSELDADVVAAHD